MRATRAYLAGLGTAGTLVLAASILFVLGSAVVAYNGWPKLGGIGAPATQTLTAHPKPGSHSTSRGLPAVAVVKPHTTRAGAPHATTVASRGTVPATARAGTRSRVSRRSTGAASISRPVASQPKANGGSSKPTSGGTTSAGSGTTTPTTTPTTPVASTPTPVASTPTPVASTGSGSGSSGSSNPVGTVTVTVGGTGTVTGPTTVASHPTATPVVSGTGSSGSSIKVVGSVPSVGSARSGGSSGGTSTPTPVVSSTGASSGANSSGSHGVSVGLGHSVSNVVAGPAGGDDRAAHGYGGSQPGHGPCPPPAGGSHGLGGPGIGPRYGRR